MRKQDLDNLKNEFYDVLIIGAGINGAVSAAALSANGLKVALIDKGDFGSFTSQESSNLIWGGIKYLETFEFKLVWDLCRSRNHLISSYPSMVKEIRFMVPHKKNFHHGLLKLYAGTLFYWFIGHFFTKMPKFHTMESISKAEPYINLLGCNGGFEYSDAYLAEHDARFVFTFIKRAKKNEANTINYIEALKSNYNEKTGWITQAQDNGNGMEGGVFNIKSKILINASGPYVNSLNSKNGVQTKYKHVLSKGIHLIVDRISKEERVITFFADDNRMFFVIPMGDKSCIGTTDTYINDLPPMITKEDRQYVLDNINKRLILKKNLTTEDIIAERCGVRPLVVEAATNTNKLENFLHLSRKHKIEVDYGKNHISMFGGKLTDCLNIGNEICHFVEKLGLKEKHIKKWYGEPMASSKKDFFEKILSLNIDKFTEEQKKLIAEHLWRRYFDDAFLIYESINKDNSLMEAVIPGVDYIKAELQYAVKNEMVVKLEDFLRRRSRIALTVQRIVIKSTHGIREIAAILFGDEAKTKLEEYFKR